MNNTIIKIDNNDYFLSSVEGDLYILSSLWGTVKPLKISLEMYNRYMASCEVRQFR